MRVPEYSAASTTSTPIDIPLRIRLRMGKFCGARESSERKLGNQRAAQGKNLFGKARVFLRVNHIDTSAKHRDCLAFGGDRSAMASGIDTARHTADDHETLRSEIAG